MKRVFGYARPSDYAVAGGMAAVSPLSFWVMERVSPSHVGKGGFAPVMRLATALGLVGGLHILYQRSCSMSSLGHSDLVPWLTIAQTASTDSQRTRERSNWTTGRWLTRLRMASRCTVLRRFPPTCREWQRETRGIRSCSSMLSHGSMVLTMTR